MQIIPPNSIKSNLTNNPLGTQNSFASYKGLDFVNTEDLKSDLEPCEDSFHSISIQDFAAKR